MSDRRIHFEDKNIHPYVGTVQSRQAGSVQDSRISRRKLLTGLGAAILAAGAAAAFSGRGVEIAEFAQGKEDGPTSEQKTAFQHLIVERFDVIPNLKLVGSPNSPAKLRTRPYSATDGDKQAGQVKSEVSENAPVGDGYATLGNEPFAYGQVDTKSVWLAILDPLRDMQMDPKPTDIRFSYIDNFALTPEQYAAVLRTAYKHSS